MAVLHCDSFDHCDTLTPKWGGSYGTVAIGASYGRLGTSGIRISNGNGGVFKALGSNPSTVIVGQAILFENVGDTHVLLTLMEGSNKQVVVKQEGGSIKIYRDTTLLDSFSLALTASVWYYFEFQVTISNAAGLVIIRVDNTEEYNSGPYFDTCASGYEYADAVIIGGNGADGDSTYTYRDDVVIMDTSGSYCASFLGDVMVQAILPTGAGANAEWDPSAGDNYACVDEVPPNTTDYVESATPNEIDSYAFGNVSPLSGTVFAVVVNAYAQKTGTAARGISGYCLDSGVPTVGNENLLTTSYGMKQSVMYINERSDAAFTIEDVNNAEFGVKLTT